MKNKLTFSLILTGILVLGTVVIVYAGASIDYGQVRNIDGIDTPPPVGTVNWTAWNQSLIDIGAVVIPQEIITEDNTNCINGEDIGYSDMGEEDDGTTDPYPEWWILMQNFDEPDPSTIFGKYKIILGGLGETYSGTLWETSFDWVNTESETNHGVVEISSTLPPNPCPTISSQPVVEPSTPEDGRSFTFSGKAGATYYVYRSQLGSGAGNDASNGRYYYLDTVVLGNQGLETYTDFDVFDGPAWYLVIQADPTSKAIIGCHSEEGTPTNVRMLGFTAEFQGSSVLVEWETAEETDILGFELYRGTSMNFNDSEKLQDVPVADNPGSMEGHSYSYTDDDIEPFTTYYYWVEIIGLDSTRDSIGPAAVRTFYELFVPFVLN